MTASTLTFTENQPGCNFALHFTFYLSTAFFNFLPHSKAIKNTRTLSVFASGRLYNFGGGSSGGGGEGGKTVENWDRMGMLKIGGRGRVVG